MIETKRILTNKDKLKKFDELRFNQSFTYNNVLFVKTDEESVDDNGDIQNAICIHSSKSNNTSGTSHFNPNTVVKIVDLEIIIK